MTDADFILPVDASSLTDDDPEVIRGMDALGVIRQLEAIEDENDLKGY